MAKLLSCVTLVLLALLACSDPALTSIPTQMLSPTVVPAPTERPLATSTSTPVPRPRRCLRLLHSNRHASTNGYPGSHAHADACGYSHCNRYAKTHRHAHAHADAYGYSRSNRHASTNGYPGSTPTPMPAATPTPTATPVPTLPRIPRPRRCLRLLPLHRYAKTHRTPTPTPTPMPTATPLQPPRQDPPPRPRPHLYPRCLAGSWKCSPPRGYSPATVKDHGSAWGVPSRYTGDSDTGPLVLWCWDRSKDATSPTGADRASIVYVRTQELGDIGNYDGETVCGYQSSLWYPTYAGFGITHIRFFDESSPSNVREYVYQEATGRYVRLR